MERRLQIVVRPLLDNSIKFVCDPLFHSGIDFSDDNFVDVSGTASHVNSFELDRRLVIDCSCHYYACKVVLSAQRRFSGLHWYVIMCVVSCCLKGWVMRARSLASGFVISVGPSGCKCVQWAIISSPPTLSKDSL